MTSKPKNTVEVKAALFFIIRFCLIVFTGLALFGWILIIILNRKTGPTYLEGISVLRELRGDLPFILISTAFIQTITLGALSSFLCLLWSHGVAGPLIRFRRSLKELTSGQLLNTPLTFRDKDQLHGVACSFSSLTLARGQRRAEALSLLASAQKILDEPQDPDLKIKKLEKIYLEIKNIYAAKSS